MSMLNFSIRRRSVGSLLIWSFCVADSGYAGSTSQAAAASPLVQSHWMHGRTKMWKGTPPARG
jgi:hypothetical protein